jgi:hypothetical protein
MSGKPAPSADRRSRLSLWTDDDACAGAFDAGVRWEMLLVWHCRAAVDLPDTGRNIAQRRCCGARPRSASGACMALRAEEGPGHSYSHHDVFVGCALWTVHQFV